MVSLKANQSRQLCKTLLGAESESEVIKALKHYDLWRNVDLWRPFGDNENNWSTIGNQQGHPVSAMVEKLINSIDAVLMRECHLRGIHPESNRAPQSITQALEDFFGIRHGNLTNITPTNRAELAKNIGFVATGRRQTPNYTVFDTGEGQTPSNMPLTLLSLTKSNKLRIPFVQGKYNMGGTGVLPFCGKHNLQLVISRRHPQIAERNDITGQRWGFTIVRREEPSAGRRSSMFTYLAPEHEVLTFETDTLELPFNQVGTQTLPSLGWGTVIKLFEYEMTGLKTNILFDLYNQISLALPKPGLPIRFYERRGYEGHTLETTMSGLYVRLQEDRQSNLEAGFPTSHEMKVRGEPMTATVYAFKKGSSDKYRKNEGVVFTINGQTHGVITQRIFSNTRVNMGYLADSILVIIDASYISGRAREDLFMNSRDRVRRGELYTGIEETLEELIRSHQGLRDLRERRRRDAIEERLSDAKPLQEVLDDIFKKSPSLTALFVKGVDIGNPTRSRRVGEQEEFVGELYPSYFRILPQDVQKQCQFHRRFRVQFETDVVNEFFDRDIYPGRFSLYQNGQTAEDYVLNLVNGIATLTVSLPADVQVGDELHYLARVEHDARLDPFDNEFVRFVIEESADTGGKPGTRKSPAGSGEGEHIAPDRLSLPEVIEIREEMWLEHDFDKLSAMRVINNGLGGYDYYVNMDNAYLRAELKAMSPNAEPKLLEARFKFALVLIALALLKDGIDHQPSDDESSESIVDRVSGVSRAVTPVLLPMIDSLGDLKVEDIIGGAQQATAH